MSDKKQVPVSLQVTPSLHPDNVVGMAAYKDEATRGLLNPVLEAFTTAYAGIQRVFAAHDALIKDKTRTVESISMDVSTFAERHTAAITKKFDAVYAQLTTSVTAIEKQLSAPILEDAERKSVSSEIRSFCRGLDTEGRFKFLNEAMANSDHTSLRACLGAVPYLSGMSAKDQALRTLQYNRQSQPELSVRLKALEDARELIRDRGPLVYGEMRKAVGTDYEEIRRLRELHTNAINALRFEA